MEELISIVHIINPVTVSESSDLFMAQPITFESMRLAKEIAEQEHPGLNVELLACVYPEDDELVPNYFEKTAQLQRSVRNIEPFSDKKKLPFIQEILDKAYEHSDFDFIVFTNVDISLYPNFYSEIYKMVTSGIDGICINRNTLPGGNYTAADLPHLVTLKGRPHEGIDCFVFKRSIIPQMQLGDAIIGTGPVGLFLAHNLLQLSKQFTWLGAEKLTFHIGDDKVWMQETVSKDSLLYFNYAELGKTLDALIEKELDSDKLEVMEGARYHTQYFLKHLKFLPIGLHRKKLMHYSDGDMKAMRSLKYDERSLEMEQSPKNWLQLLIKTLKN